MDNIQITTVLSLDCDYVEPMRVIHLVQGDYGTRALRMVPVHQSRLINMQAEGYVQAKVRLACEGHEALLIDCELGDTYATLVPTPAMVSGADEWTAQLVLYKEDNTMLSTQEFRINVHGTVYNGDVVEHTSSKILSVSYDDQGRLSIETDDGRTVSADETVQEAHTHDLAAADGEQTTGNDGFMSKTDKAFLDSLAGMFDQSVKTDATPEFAGLKIGNLEINDDGYITGARFASAEDVGPTALVIVVEGATPVITGEKNRQYICGTVTSISITPPASGIIDVRFTCGSTPATLTVPNTVKWPAWFDGTLEASRTYEINILDGVYGVVYAWQ